MLSPIALAALMLMISSNLVGNWTGRSATLASRSRKGQKPASIALFDHLVRDGKKPRRHADAEHSCGLRVNN